MNSYELDRETRIYDMENDPEVDIVDILDHANNMD